MIRFKIVQNTNKVIQAAYLKWYARPVVEENVDIEGLAEHMSNHNSPYSRGVLVGILTDAVSCIKEMLLEGKSVRIDDLASFSVGIVSKKGAESKEEFTIANNIEGVKLRARAIGELSSTQLNLDAVLKHATLDKTTSSNTTDDGGDDDDKVTTTPSTGSNSSSGSNKDEDLYEPGEDGMM
jgi:predicted histone-like DNA-binding protein